MRLLWVWGQPLGVLVVPEVKTMRVVEEGEVRGGLGVISWGDWLWGERISWREVQPWRGGPEQMMRIVVVFGEVVARRESIAAASVASCATTTEGLVDLRRKSPSLAVSRGSRGM